MNRTFLADALDFWKGYILRWLVEGEVLHDLRVDGMFTGAPWADAYRELYADLLAVAPHRLVNHNHPLDDRMAYFREIPSAGDLFIDPDTGVRTSWSPHPDRYVTPLEIRGLIGTADRLVAVYQHVSRITVMNRLQRVTTVLHRKIPRLHCCSANSATVALIFLSLSHERIQQTFAVLQDLYGSAAPTRTCMWRPGRLRGASGLARAADSGTLTLVPGTAGLDRCRAPSHREGWRASRAR